MYKKNIVLEYFHTFTRSFNITAVMWMLYLAAKGFSLFQIGLFEGIFHLTSMTMEIPTGAIADIYGRKISRILGVFLNMFHLLILAFSNNFWVIGLGFVFCALSYTLESGAGDALVYDSLLEDKNEKQFVKVNGRKEIIFQVSSMLAAVVGGYIASINHSLVFKVMLGITIISLVLLSFLKETTIDKHPDGIKAKSKDQYVDSFKYVLNNRKLILFIVVGNLLAFPVTVLFFYSQNYYIYLGYTEFHIGIFMGLFALSAVVGAWISTKIHIKEVYLFTIIPIIMIALIWAYLTPYSWIAFALLGAFESIMYIVILNHINHMIPSNKRATILSISSMMFSLMMILVFPLVGLLSDLYSFKVGFTFNASIVTLAYIVYLIKFRQFNEE